MSLNTTPKTSPYTATVHPAVSVWPIQERAWFLQQIGAAGRDAAISIAIALPEHTTMSTIPERWSAAIARWDALRLAFAAEGDQIRAWVRRPAELRPTLTEIRLSGPIEDPLVLEGALASLRDTVSAAETSGDQPLIRAALLSGADGRMALALAANRLIADPASLDALAAWLLRTGTSDTEAETAPVPVSAPAPVADPSLALSRLHHATTALDLPFDRPRSPVQAGAMAQYAAPLSQTAAAHLQALAERTGAEPGTILLTAYCALLYRYTLQDDFLVAVPTRATEPDAIGPLTDTALIRAQFPEDTSQAFADLLSALRPAFSEAWDGAHVPPFTAILAALNPPRDLSRAPLAQIGYTYLSSGRVPGNLHHLRTSPPLQLLDLLLCVRETRDGLLRLEWHYDTALFEAVTITRMQAHLETLLVSAAADPDAPIANLRLTPPAEEILLRVTWNQTAAQVPDPDLVYRLFEKQAARTPSAIAARVAGAGAGITYDALNRRANRMAAQLAATGIGVGAIVPILADRDIDFLTAMLAINKAGAAFLPLSPAYPARRLAAILEKCAAPLVIVGPKLMQALAEAVDRLPGDGRPAIGSVADYVAADAPEDNPPDRGGPQDIAYAMFTSGSTGEPKGVLVHHAGMINHNWAKIGDTGMTAADSLAQTSRQSFDIIVWQFLAPLIVGGQVVIIPDEMGLDPAQLLRALDEEQISIAQLVPVNIEALLDVAEAHGDRRPLLRALRWMIPTGDALQTDLCRRWLTLYPHTRMLNTYGATECSDDQCHHVIAVPPPATYRPPIMTVGRPILNTQAYILDSRLRIVPIGVVGELYIGGVGVGPGYLRDPERTAGAFIPDPFAAPGSGARLYRSGDQARYLPDGTIEFLGRIGHLVKIRGVRIEPGEIQAALVRLGQVAQAAVIAHEGHSGAELAAYLVWRDGDNPLRDEDLRAALRQTLPENMIPAYFVPLPALPLNANGKLDRRALPPPPTAGSSPAGTPGVAGPVAPPRGEAERRLLEIWQKVLGFEAIGIHDNFFDIGGHSLLAMRLFSRIERGFGQRLPLASIFRAPTIAEQARLLNAPSEAARPGNSVPDMPDPTVTGLLPGLTSMVRLQPGDPARPPFFCVHAHGGNVLYFHNLARLMGTDQPFYGIQALGIDGRNKPLNRFEDLAAVYVREIRAVQPEGPYYLGGECMGGSIAFEVTRQIEAQGQQVRLLVMFDAFCAGIPTLRPGVPMWLYEIVFNIRRFRRMYFAQLRAAPWRQKPRFLVDIVQRTVITLRRIFLSRWLDKTDIEDPLSVTHAALQEAQDAFRPGIIDAQITLFNSELPWGVTGDQTLGWDGHSRAGVQVEQFSTLFDTMIEGPDVKFAAPRLRQVIDTLLTAPAKADHE